MVLIVSGQIGANTVTSPTACRSGARQNCGRRSEAEKRAAPCRSVSARDFIAIATENVLEALLIGGALVIVVLFLFLFDCAPRDLISAPPSRCRCWRRWWP